MSFRIEKYHFNRRSILEGLPAKESSLLREKMLRREVKKGLILFTEGSFPKGVYFIQKGRVKIFQTNAQDKEHILCIYSKGESFGYRPILSHEPNPVSAKTLEDCILSFIPASSFIKILNKSSTLSNKLLRALSREYAAWANKTSSFARKKVPERVALSLLILSEKYKVKDRPFVEITISRDDLAGFVGAAKETVVRTLALFKDEKIIKTNMRGDITILRHNELERIVDAL